MKIPRRFSGFIKVFLKFARSIYKDPQKLKRFLNFVRDYAKKNKKYILKFRDDLFTLYYLLLAWWRGEYTKAPVSLIIWTIVALAYFLTPIDLIPDFLGPGGYIDDAFVIGLVIRSYKKEIDAFRRWQNRK